MWHARLLLEATLLRNTACESFKIDVGIRNHPGVLFRTQLKTILEAAYGLKVNSLEDDVRRISRRCSN